MSLYELTLKRLQTGSKILTRIKADNLEDAHYQAICEYGNDIVLLNAREITNG